MGIFRLHTLLACSVNFTVTQANWVRNIFYDARDVINQLPVEKALLRIFLLMVFKFPILRINICTYFRHRTIYTAISITLHIISLTISYFLMLIAMTFNVWLFLAVILGSGLGKLVTMIFMDSTSEDTSQSHCNMP